MWPQGRFDELILHLENDSTAHKVFSAFTEKTLQLLYQQEPARFPFAWRKMVVDFFENTVTEVDFKSPHIFNEWERAKNFYRISWSNREYFHYQYHRLNHHQHRRLENLVLGTMLFKDAVEMELQRGCDTSGVHNRTVQEAMNASVAKIEKQPKAVVVCGNSPEDGSRAEIQAAWDEMYKKQPARIFNEQEDFEAIHTLREQQQDIVDFLEKATDHFQRVADNLNPQGEIPVSKTFQPIKVYSVTYVEGASINNAVANDLTNDEIFEAISLSEKEIEKLSALKNKPKTLIKRLQELQEGINALVAVVDARSE